MKKLVLTLVLGLLWIVATAQDTPPTDTIAPQDAHRNLLVSYIESLQDLSEKANLLKAQLERIESDINHNREKILLVGSMYADPRTILSVTPEGDIIKTKDVSKHSE